MSGCVLIIDDGQEDPSGCDQEAVSLAPNLGLMSDLAADVSSDFEDDDLDDTEEGNVHDFDPLESHRDAQRWLPLPTPLRSDQSRRAFK